MKSLKTKHGFTLIELLVVITIIGILATGGVTVYTSQIQKARDTNRINDIKALQSGVEQFYQDTSEYPQGGADWLSNANTDVQDYSPRLAIDPKDHQNCNGSKCGYAYRVAPDANGVLQGAYELSTAFENDGIINSKATGDGGNDPDRLEIFVGSTTLATLKATGATSLWGVTALASTNNSAVIHIGTTAVGGTNPTVTAF